MELSRKYLIFELTLIMLMVAFGTYEGQLVVGSIPLFIGCFWAYKRSQSLYGCRQSVYYERIVTFSVLMILLKLIPLLLALGVIWALLYVFFIGSVYIRYL